MESSTGFILLGVAIALIIGLASNRLIRFLKLPNVTGYLVVGILLGPYLFSLFSSFGGVLSVNIVKKLGIIVDIALGFIAFSIGSEFKLSSIKKMGKGIITITLMQSVMALVFVDIALISYFAISGNLMNYLPIALTLGAVATATAPAATLMVIKQYKAKGPVTDILLPVVAFDDAVGLILFSISFAIAQVFAKQAAGLEANISVVSIIFIPLAEIASSIGIGGLIGFILAQCMKWFKSRANRLICMLAAVFLSVALCQIFQDKLHFELSSLLTCMMVGAVFCNIRKDAISILEGVDRWTPALFMLFFILSGAELDFKAFGNVIVLIICLIYLISRSLGKYFGARWGASLAKEQNPNIKKYLGLTLLPQAGVAIGMARSASSTFSTIASQYSDKAQYFNNIGTTITAVVLCATLVYELVGPVITKISLTKAGEIIPPTQINEPKKTD